MQVEICKNGNILGALLALCQFGKDQETAVALAIAHTNGLPSDSQVVKIAFGNVATPHDANGTDGFKSEVDKGQQDAHAEDPF